MIDITNRFDTYCGSEVRELFPHGECYCECSEGWWKPIRAALTLIIRDYHSRVKMRESLLENNPWNHPVPPEVDKPQVFQIKEKFGGIRLYIDGGDHRFIYGVVAMLEMWCASTCEVCGDHGARVNMGGRGWLKTVCEAHNV